MRVCDGAGTVAIAPTSEEGGGRNVTFFSSEVDRRLFQGVFSVSLLGWPFTRETVLDNDVGRAYLFLETGFLVI